MAPLETRLTPIQQEVLDLMWTTKTKAKVRRRFTNLDDSFRFEDVVRLTRPIDFAQEGEFVLKLHEKKPNAPLSPSYVNLRNLSRPLLAKVAQAMVDATPIDVYCCTGIPNAGDPIAKKYAEINQCFHVDIFTKSETSDGRKIVVTPGAINAGAFFKSILLVDDVITRGETKLEAIKAAESLGYKVLGVAVLVDREQGGRQQLAANGYKLFTPFTISSIFEYYRSTDRIDQAKYDQCLAYLQTSQNSQH